MGAIRQTAQVRTDTVTTHVVRIDIEPGVMPSMGNDDICEISLVINAGNDRPSVVKKVKLNYRDMTTLCSQFVVRDF